MKNEISCKAKEIKSMGGFSSTWYLSGKNPLISREMAHHSSPSARILTSKSTQAEKKSQVRQAARSTIPFLIFLCFLAGCKTNSWESKDFESMSTSEFSQEISPYLVPGTVLDDEIPALNVPTATEALQAIVSDVLNNPSDNPFYKGSIVGRHFDEAFLKEVKIGAPILIYKFMEEKDYRKNYFYLFYAAHPIYGTVAKIYYNFSTTDNNYHLGSIVYSLGSQNSFGTQIVSQKQAQIYAESILGVHLDRSPIAVALPDRDYFYSHEDFAWYFEIPETQVSASSGGHREFLLEPYYSGYLLNETEAESAIVSRFGIPSTPITNLPSRLSRLVTPLNLYDIVEENKANQSRSIVVQEQMWDKCGQVQIEAFE